jgi:predicted nucleotidyltransferase
VSFFRGLDEGFHLIRTVDGNFCIVDNVVVKKRITKTPTVLLPRLLDEVKHFYDDRLITLAVFGSSGRGTATVESDIDLLVVAHRLRRNSEVARNRRARAKRHVKTCRNRAAEMA